ncbi:MAG: parallel beta-helix domain-containing protein [Myxococcota bacterium]
MKNWLFLCALAALVGCGDDDGGGTDPGEDMGMVTTDMGGGGGDAFPNMSCADVEGTCLEIEDAATLVTEANLLDDGTTLVLAEATFELDNAVTIRANGISVVGQGMDETTLDYGTGTTQFNGLDVVGDNFRVEGLTLLDAPKDALRVEDSDGVIIRAIRTTWTNEGDSTNGAYGIYPVKSQNVLVENCEALNASDAGLYVGQSENVIVRNNLVRGNVAGLEIENTQFADVYDNVAEDNTGGIVVFDLPGNPIVGRDVRLRDNMIINNNRANFAPGGVVREIPPGTGTFAMASRRVEITGNTYMNNQTLDIAIISGLVVEGDTSAWELETASLVGMHEDLGLLPGSADGTVSKFRSENIVIANNSHSGSGMAASTANMLGQIVALQYGAGNTVDSVLYDGIGESSFDGEDIAGNSNDNRLCVGGNTGGTLGLINLEAAPGPILGGIEAPFGAFGCTELDGGPVAEVTIP